MPGHFLEGRSLSRSAVMELTRRSLVLLVVSLTASVDQWLAPAHRGEDPLRPRLGGRRQALRFALDENGL